MALLMAFPVSTGIASTLLWSIPTSLIVLWNLTSCLHRLRSSSIGAMLANKQSEERKRMALLRGSGTYSHAHCDDESNRRPDDLAVARIILSIII